MKRTLIHQARGKGDGFDPLFRQLWGDFGLSFSSQRGDVASYRGEVRLASSLEDRGADTVIIGEET
ncbi:hypothetical protein OB919_21420 [Halobacteria archaeon AArc-curdl1]|uniref:Uncharacterized protein n=1 Tax=Natronosalvus hydrolyticus TaxID=2979988 RepID=A0AAP3E903_9EURY|nr:hypothetical protein [Halobacteria archaeon AArc-curdl1]